MNFLPINWPLIRNPLNWAIILLMVAIAGIALNEIFRFISPTGGCGCNKSALSDIPSETA